MTTSSVRARIAGAPISWGVCEAPDWGIELSPDRVLAEMCELGLTTTELGPTGYLGATPAAVTSRLAAAGMRLLGGFLPVPMHIDASLDLAEATAAMDTLAAAGAELVVLAARSADGSYDAKVVPDEDEWPILVRNNTLLWGGCSSWNVDNGVVTTENIVTTYVTNAQGNPDDSYLEVETLFLSAYILRQLRTVVQGTYGRKKLAANGTRLLPNSNVVTPDVIRADLIAKYRELEAQGFVQQSQEFAANLIVEQNADNPNRVDVLYPAVLIDQLRVFAVLFQFRLV